MNKRIKELTNNYLDKHSKLKNKDAAKEAFQWLINAMTREVISFEHSDITVKINAGLSNIRVDNTDNKRKIISEKVKDPVIAIESKLDSSISFFQLNSTFELDYLSQNNIREIIKRAKFIEIKTKTQLNEALEEKEIDKKRLIKNELKDITLNDEYLPELPAYPYFRKDDIYNKKFIQIDLGIIDVDNSNEFRTLLKSELKREANEKNHIFNELFDKYNYLNDISDNIEEGTFIANGSNDKEKNYRYDFLRWCKKIESESKTSSNIFERCINHTKSEEIIQNIDKGIFPLKELLSEYLPPNKKFLEKYLIRCIQFENIIKASRYKKLAGYVATGNLGDYDKFMQLIKTDLNELDPVNLIVILESLKDGVDSVESGKLQLKTLKQKNDWLFKSENYIESSKSFWRKYNPDTLIDFNTIQLRLIEPLSHRIILEKARKYDCESDIFQISDESYTVEPSMQLLNEKILNEIYENQDDELFMHHAEELDDLDTFSTKAITEADLYTCTKGMFLLDKAKANLKIHNSLKYFNNALAKYHKTDNDITWTPLCSDQEYNSHTVKCINSRKDLHELETELDNCAYTYLEQCMAGKSFVFEIREKGTEKTPTCFELKYDEEKSVFYSNQHYGFDNKKISPEQIESKIHDKFLNDINNDLFEIDMNTNVQNEEILSYLSSDPENVRIPNTLDAARTFSKYDFDSDAAYLSYFISEKFLGRETLDNLLIDNNLMDNSLELFRQIERIRYISNKTKIPPIDLIINAKEKNISINSRKLASAQAGLEKTY